MRHRVGDKIQGQGKHRHKKLTIMAITELSCKVKSDYGRENGRVHYLSNLVIERYYTKIGR